MFECIRLKCIEVEGISFITLVLINNYIAAICALYLGKVVAYNALKGW